MQPIEIIERNNLSFVESLTDAIGEILRLTGPIGGKNLSNFYFRGQNSTKFDLRPRIMRQGGFFIDEMYAVRMIFQKHANLFEKDTYMIDRLSRLRHWNFPTRLLDVTLSPLVALYFALYGDNTGDGVVYIVGFDDSELKTRDSDSISVLANYSLISKIQQDHILSLASQDDCDGCDWLNACEPLVQVVQRERPYFTNSISRTTFSRYYIVDAAHIHARIASQAGAFIMFGPASPIEQSTNSFIRKHVTAAVVIRSAHKRKIMLDLNRLGINKRALFPEIESTVEFINNNWYKTYDYVPNNCIDG